MLMFFIFTQYLHSIGTSFKHVSISPIQFTHKYTPFVCSLFYPAHVIVQFTHSMPVPSIHAHAWPRSWQPAFLLVIGRSRGSAAFRRTIYFDWNETQRTVPSNDAALPLDMHSCIAFSQKPTKLAMLQPVYLNFSRRGSATLLPKQCEKATFAVVSVPTCRQITVSYRIAW